MKMTEGSDGAIRVSMACNRETLLPMSDMDIRLDIAETCNEFVQLG